MKSEKSYKVDKALFLSIKAEFVEKIFNGTKTIELRKSTPKIYKDTLIIIYCTSPVMSIIGTCKVEDLILLEPNELWNKHSKKTGIDKERYFEYYDGKDLAVGIILKDAVKLKKAIPLSKIRSSFSNFHPPQTFRYFNTESLNRLFNSESDYI